MRKSHDTRPIKGVTLLQWIVRLGGRGLLRIWLIMMMRWPESLGKVLRRRLRRLVDQWGSIGTLSERPRLFLSKSSEVIFRVSKPACLRLWLVTRTGKSSALLFWSGRILVKFVAVTACIDRNFDPEPCEKAAALSRLDSTLLG